MKLTGTPQDHKRDLIIYAFAITVVAAWVWLEDRTGSGGLFAACIVLGGFAYLLPTMIAQSRRARSMSGIFFINLLFGWTIIGYIAAFIWACVDKPQAE